MDITMNAPPTAAEVRAANLDKESPDYFRFNWSGMSSMLIAMAAADAVADDPEPKFGDPPRDKAKLAAYEAKGKLLLRTHSATAGRVPAFKFRSNSGWIVASDEAAVIATRLTAYAARATQADLDLVNRAYDDAQAKLDAAIQKSQPGEVSLTATSEGLGMTLDEYRLWLLQWATYNAVAAKHGGYHVD